MRNPEYIVEVLPNDECITKGELIRCRECRHSWVESLYKYNMRHCREKKMFVADDDYCRQGDRRDEVR